MATLAGLSRSGLPFFPPPCSRHYGAHRSSIPASPSQWLHDGCRYAPAFFFPHPSETGLPVLGGRKQHSCILGLFPRPKNSFLAADRSKSAIHDKPSIVVLP